MVGPRNPSPDFWSGKSVLVTGHTGFKGAWLSLWLARMGARVSGLSLAPATEPNLFELIRLVESVDSHFVDIRDSRAVADVVRRVRPEVVLHLAAQALVLDSYADPLATFATNVQGTANVLDALRGLETVRVAVAITTDKVYENAETAFPFRETDALGGHDPYSASKAASEIVVASYRRAFLAEAGVALASARAGNVIGGGDWAANRLIPDAVRAWGKEVLLDVRRPGAVRPWQHVLEPLAGYLQLAEALWAEPSLAGGYNFGPETHEAAPVRRVLELARAAFGRGETAWGEGNPQVHEANWLSLEISKARRVLGVAPRWDLATCVERTMTWYRAHLDGTNARDLCYADFEAFEATGNMDPRARGNA